MITLTLLHPLQHVPVQSWSFEQESVIRIGRSTDNHVILYSAVVSRHHVELRLTNSQWEIVNIGTNGTYLEGKRITQVPVVDGITIRLARSGPNIQIRLNSPNGAANPQTATGERTLSQGINQKVLDARAAEEKPASSGTIPVPPHLQIPSPAEPDALPSTFVHTVLSSEEFVPERITAPHIDEKLGQAEAENPVSAPSGCQHPRAQPGLRFCLDCGFPLQVQQTIGNYQILQTLGQGSIGTTYLAWHQGHNLVLKTLNQEWLHHPQALELFAQEADILKRCQHPGLPEFFDFFTVADQPYLAMEMVYGKDLGQYVASRGPVSPNQAIAWTLEVCEILEQLHNATPEIVHQNIHPSRLILRTTPCEGHALALVDFGAVKRLALEAGIPAGSEGYTAPEQQAGQATTQSDLYALGATLVHLLTGQDPIDFYTTRDLGFRLYVDQIPGLPPDLAEVIHKLTQPALEDRFASATTVAEALRSLAPV